MTKHNGKPKKANDLRDQLGAWFDHNPRGKHTFEVDRGRALFSQLDEMCRHHNLPTEWDPTAPIPTPEERATNLKELLAKARAGGPTS